MAQPRCTVRCRLDAGDDGDRRADAGLVRWRRAAVSRKVNRDRRPSESIVHSVAPQAQSSADTESSEAPPIAEAERHSPSAEQAAPSGRFRAAHGAAVVGVRHVARTRPDDDCQVGGQGILRANANGVT